ncbi:DUF47 family protein [Haloactinopolyspora sp.]|uniref:DUF47 domain-containing protein n=1 Tax=Haloactinopolyspora sp. TaxID=1966353 RepID=UPI002627E833|nr:DUF47 family protein [Haloactinopolyspora sp.]
MRRWRARRGGAAGLSKALAGQVHAALEGAAVARAMVADEITPAQARSRIAEVEHRGDAMRAALIEKLSRTLVVPLDREDIFRLSRSIDDVLDTIREFIREADLYQIEDRRSYVPVVEAVGTAIEALEAALEALWRTPGDVLPRALEAKKAARAVNREYQNEFARIVGGELSPRTLKHRELVKRLDWVGVRISEAADVLADGALKRGY